MNIYSFTFIAFVIVAPLVWFMNFAIRSADDYDEQQKREE